MSSLCVSDTYVYQVWQFYKEPPLQVPDGQCPLLRLPQRNRKYEGTSLNTVYSYSSLHLVHKALFLHILEIILSLQTPTNVSPPVHIVCDAIQ